MKIKVEIISISTNGEDAEVCASGNLSKDPDWKWARQFKFGVPLYIARRYAVGQTLTLSITPGRKS